MSFESLCDEIRACSLCKDKLPMGPNPVFQASPQSRILIAGQAPGIRVHKTSIPFNDPSGDRLREWMGIGKDTFYDKEQIAIVPMGFCYPGTADRGDLPPLPECSQTWHERLLLHLTDIQLVLPIGIYAQRYYLSFHPNVNFFPLVNIKPHQPPRQCWGFRASLYLWIQLPMMLEMEYPYLCICNTVNQ